jgi:8-oxo-dGTP pyrophosphatase MutT (NUDIX family)
MTGRVLYERCVPSDDRNALTIDVIRRRLAGHSPLLHPVVPEVTRVRAAVAMVMRPAARDVEVLFIRRAPLEGDPWSGDIAFPGGRVNLPDEPARAAAERETREEVGIDLERADCLGQLDDAIGGGGAVVVSGFVYALRTRVVLRTNHEVAAAGWVPVSRFAERDRQSLQTYRYKDRDVRLPALKIFDDDSPHLWGLTYQFIERFMRMLDREIPAMPWRDSD